MFYSLHSRNQPDRACNAGNKDVLLHDDLGGIRQRWGKLNTKINDDALAHGSRESGLREELRGTQRTEEACSPGSIQENGEPEKLYKTFRI